MRAMTVPGRGRAARCLLTLTTVLWLVGAMAAFSGVSIAVGADDVPPPRPAHIHRGTCEALEPAPVYPLADLTMMPAGATPAAAEAAAAPPATMSVTTVDVPLSELLADSYAINIHESAEEQVEYLACGAIAGEPGADGLAVGLAPHGSHGDFSGVAWLRPQGDQTMVAVFLTEGIMAARVAVPTPAPGVAPEEFAVTLGGAAGEFSIATARTAFRVGVPYRFVVTNAGQVPHELLIIPPMLVGQMEMEGAHHMALGLIDEEDLPPGATETLEITFTRPAPEGTLELACYVPGHYEAGMHLPIEVAPG